MQYTQQTNSDLNVSEVCLGSMTWGNQNTAEDSAEQIDYTIERGINFIGAAQ